MTFSIHGLAVARGIAIGRAVLVASSRVDVAHYFIDASQIDAELQRVKTQWVASEIYKLDSVFNQARELGVAWTLGLPPDYGSQLIARLRQVTPAQVQAVAQKYFGDDSLTVATLRPQPLSGQPRARRAAPGARH